MSSISRRSVIKTYKFYAPLYDYLFGAILAPGRREAARVVHDLRPNSLLEVGVGTGLSLSLYPHGIRVDGIDLCPQMLARAREKVERLRLQEISLSTMDAEEMDFPDDHFDCVIACYVLSVTPDVDRLVAELQRVCKKGGTIIVLNHFSGSRFWWLLERGFRKLADKVGFRSDFRYEKQILRPGWEVEQVRSVNLFGLSKLVILRNV